MRSSRCRACYNERQRRLSYKRRGLEVPPKKVFRPEQKRCPVCGQDKDRFKDFYPRRGRGRLSVTPYCKDCSVTIQREYRQTDTGREAERRSRQRLDVARRALSDAPMEYTSDRSKLAYVRGYLAGQRHRQDESSSVERHRDLLFRIASEMARKYRGKRLYEDIVQDGYMGLLSALRSRRELSETHMRAYVAQRIRGEIVDSVRRETSANYDRAAKTRHHEVFSASELKGENGEIPRMEELAVSSPQAKEAEAADTVAYFLPDLTPKESELVRLKMNGLNNREIGDRWGITESRVCQILGKIRSSENAAALLPT